MAKLGKIKIINEKESDTADVDVTSYPVEKGIPITDHVQRKPETTSVSGYLLGSSANSDYEYLKKQQYAGKLMQYTGRKIAKNVLITNINRDIGEIKNGFAITVELQEIRIAKSPWVKKKTKNAGKKKKSSTKKSKAVYHKVKKGETYSHMRMWYGTSLSQLRKWNKYPDRRIPIGVKLRVK
ncbi:LysM domain-containing protein [Bacillus atrophaeus]|uniref:LysM peptidoglycan-binding domain-containing protein n=1 Tax=Bacillus TaxID=1386 RepID=UPI001CA65C3E|nr:MULTISPECIES: LysM domain-containing protein [Bacillus]MBY8913315.1 LysM peptidoglycan-binding domain-containing protein [Bacillus sp. YC2]MCY7919562.1 LysM peptidoglycan-binding domain-containing protein [Bacillus vallismortis]MCY8813681.1 LysM peptidoglycan-binding domain-containing protein [Bacillus atrophaeus]MCY8820246.1 LysM peptidoglycan-binding domain-containing protein [Bacillus atrophaeus]MCY8828630.1 LysM peptidoglycan-binding domain-containing protein [Bacillus atrophaeus]